jgi:lysine-specific demethylase 8
MFTTYCASRIQTKATAWAAFVERRAGNSGFPRRLASSSALTSYERRPVAHENMTAVHSSQQDIADALRPHYKNQTPVVLRGAIGTAPAIDSWQSLEYLQETVGDDAMGVEIGGTYGSVTAERPEIPFGAYIQYLQLFEERHGRHGNDHPWDLTNVPPQEELVYMAQNDLPAALYKDVEIPAFCNDSQYNLGLGRLYQTMLWLGPRGCVSPLHHDPLDNCLMQLVGRKRVLLFSPIATSETLWHYAGSDGQQSNTSPVNVESPDLTKYPFFAEAAPPALECVLHPGDVLVIPKKWWHHVRSLDTSVSANVWWR